MWLVYEGPYAVVEMKAMLLLVCMTAVLETWQREVEVFINK